MKSVRMQISECLQSNCMMIHCENKIPVGNVGSMNNFVHERIEEIKRVLRAKFRGRI